MITGQKIQFLTATLHTSGHFVFAPEVDDKAFKAFHTTELMMCLLY